jgi:16S rRNA (uracil1498-N3)-methyltransferase
VHARFYAPEAGAPGDVVVLPDDEAEHLTRVLRVAIGDSVRAFNGRGSEFDAVVDAAGKSGVRLRIGAPRIPAPEPSVAVTLAQAVLKGDKMDDVVRDAVMLGVAAIQPLITTRTETSVVALARGRRRERWERIAVSSAKQCGRAVVPAIREPQRLDHSGQAAVRDFLPPPVFTCVEPGASLSASLSDVAVSAPRAATLVIGPEGGWTDEELQAAAIYGALVTLGGRTLRADAMALVALSALFTRWREF